MRLLHTAILAAVIFSQLGSASLREVAGARNLRVGTAMQARLLTEAAYTQAAAETFNLLTPENEMKFGPIHPARDTYNFTNADALVEFAAANKMQIKGHTLVWHSQLAPWVNS